MPRSICLASASCANLSIASTCSPSSPEPYGRLAEQLDRLGVRVVLKPFLIEDLLSAISGALTAQALIAEATDDQARS